MPHKLNDKANCLFYLLSITSSDGSNFLQVTVGSISSLVLARVRLVIQASVTESGSGLTEQALDDAIQFASHPYVIEFLNKQRKFQIGASTPIHVSYVQAYLFVFYSIHCLTVYEVYDNV